MPVFSQVGCTATDRLCVAGITRETGVVVVVRIAGVVVVVRAAGVVVVVRAAGVVAVAEWQGSQWCRSAGVTVAVAAVTAFAVVKEGIQRLPRLQQFTCWI
jgi:hypothetical protein